MTLSPAGKDQLKWIEISRSNLEHNISVIRDLIGPETNLMGVVKANAYGHGMSLAARCLLNSGVDYLGVVSLEEAKMLRNSGLKVPIFIISYISPGKVDEVIRYNLQPVVFSLDFVKALERMGEKTGAITEVTVKVETGMNRHGLQGEKLRKVMDFLAGAKFVKVVGFSTHFARSDESDPEPTSDQMSRMNAAIDAYRKKGFALNLNHAANSAATLLYPETHLRMVRCGLALYGLYPSDYVMDKHDGPKLRPALEFKTRIAQLRLVEKGQTVSYGGTWTAPKPTRIAVIPVGYADGYRRDLSNKGHVIIRNQKAPILGRVCMNLSMVDVSEIAEVAESDEVTLISTDQKSGATVNDLSTLIGTINYEVISGLSEAIERFLVP